MLEPNLVNDLKRDEGLRLTAYKDTVGVWTIGYGHTPAYEGQTICLEDAEDLLMKDIEVAEAGLDKIAPWWRTLDDVRQNVLVEMCFNMGPTTLSKFVKFLGNAKAGKFGLAAAQMLMSKWATQVGDRAMRLSILMEHGVYKEGPPTIPTPQCQPPSDHELLERLIKQMSDLSTAVTALQAQVTAEATVEQSAIALLNGIPGVVAAALAAQGADEAAQTAAVTAVTSAISANSAALAAAVTANTPAAAPAA